jgi:putative Ca2+/H+ antiporter (TMEM165/GDT1 family)
MTMALQHRRATYLIGIFLAALCATICGTRVLSMLPLGSPSYTIEICKLVGLVCFLLVALWHRQSDRWEIRAYAFTVAAGFSFMSDWGWFMQLTSA